MQIDSERIQSQKELGRAALGMPVPGIRSFFLVRDSTIFIVKTLPAVLASLVLWRGVLGAPSLAAESDPPYGILTLVLLVNTAALIYLRLTISPPGPMAHAHSGSSLTRGRGEETIPPPTASPSKLTPPDPEGFHNMPLTGLEVPPPTETFLPPPPAPPSQVEPPTGQPQAIEESSTETASPISLDSLFPEEREFVIAVCRDLHLDPVGLAPAQTQEILNATWILEALEADLASPEALRFAVVVLRGLPNDGRLVGLPLSSPGAAFVSLTRCAGSPPHGLDGHLTLKKSGFLISSNGSERFFPFARVIGFQVREDGFSIKLTSPQEDVSLAGISSSILILAIDRLKKRVPEPVPSESVEPRSNGGREK